MKNKNGFTLIEILAVIAILCILVTIATFSVMKTKENSMKKLLNIKIGELEASGILYGQENQEELNLKCTIDNEKYEFCTKKTVKELIDSDYYKSNEVNSSGQKDLLNNVTNESMLNDIVMIYKKNNRVYAKYIEGETKSGTEEQVECSNIMDVCKKGNNLANCIITFSQKCKVDVSKIYYHDSNLENGAGDNSYRYAGASDSVNNFVCFGSDAATCPNDNLYRIIGVIDDKVKLIKADYANSNLLGTNGDYHDSVVPNTSFYKGKLTSINTYYWNYNNDTTLGHSSNDWSTSLLNKTNLNTNYINNIGSSWANKIDVTTWKIGGNSWDGVIDTFPNVTYQKEINTPENDTTYDAKIGLMYVSDYLFGANPNTWELKDYYGNGAEYHDYKHHNTTNWLYLGGYEWTITHDTKDDTQVFFVYGGLGLVLTGTFKGLRLEIPGIFENNIGTMYIRPVFNLMSSVTYVSGNGTFEIPIRIN